MRGVMRDAVAGKEWKGWSGVREGGREGGREGIPSQYDNGIW